MVVIMVILPKVVKGLEDVRRGIGKLVDHAFPRQETIKAYCRALWYSFAAILLRLGIILIKTLDALLSCGIL